MRYLVNEPDNKQVLAVDPTYALPKVVGIWTYGVDSPYGRANGVGSPIRDYMAWMFAALGKPKVWVPDPDGAYVYFRVPQAYGQFTLGYAILSADDGEPAWDDDTLVGLVEDWEIPLTDDVQAAYLARLAEAHTLIPALVTPTPEG